MFTFRIITLVLIYLGTARAGPPIFDEDLSVINVREGIELVVECSARGDPEPRYTWFNETGDELRSDLYPSIAINNGRNFSQLILSPTDSSQSGVYTCTARNSHGLRSKIFEITINSSIDDDEDTIESAVLVNVTETTATFLIKGSEKVNEVSVQFIETVEKINREMSFSGNTIVVENLIPSGKYTFRFSPKVQTGHWKTWFQTQTVVLLPGVPDVIFHSLSNGVLKINWYRSYDSVLRETIDKHQLSYYYMRMDGGNSWIKGSCPMSIEIPKCFGTSYTIPDLAKKTYYEITLSAHTSAGYGKPYINKIYIPDE